MSRKNEVLVLHELADDFVELMEIFERTGGEITEETEAQMAKVQDALVTKTDNVVNWVEYQHSLVSLAEERMERLKALINQVEKRVINFESYLGGCLKMMGKDKLEGETKTIKLRKPKDVVYIENENDLPFEFLTIPEAPKAKPDLKAIKAEIDKGNKVPGAIVVQSKTVSVIYGFKK